MSFFSPFFRLILPLMPFTLKVQSAVASWFKVSSSSLLNISIFFACKVSIIRLKDKARACQKM